MGVGSDWLGRALAVAASVTSTSREKLERCHRELAALGG